MAVQTIYILAQAGVTPNFFGPTQLNGTAPTAANTTYGWGPARVSVATPYYRGRLGATTTGTDTAAASSYNAGTTGPTKGTGTGATTAGDSFIAGPFTGTFAATAWTFNWNLRAVTAGCVGHVNMRVWKSANPDGTSATQLLANTAGATVTLSTSADVNSSISWSPGSLTLNNEYLFFQVEWQETTQGANPINDVFFRTGTSSITTADLLTIWGDHGSYITLSNGNLDATNISTGNNRSTVRANTPHNYGLWYCEVEILAGTNYQYTAFGACDDTSQGALLNTDGGTPANAGGTRVDGTGFYNGFAPQGGTAIPSVNVGDRIQIAVDCASQGLYLGSNNTWTTGSNPSTLTNPRFTWTTLPGINVYPWVDTIQGNVVRIHSDAASQTYAPPTGFQPWSAADNISSHKLVRSFTLSNERNNFTGWVGAYFITGTDRTYDKVGLYCGAGSTGTHNVRLYATGTPGNTTPTLAQSWTIDLTGATPGGFAYGAIPQVTLTAGTVYILVRQVTSGNGQFWAEQSNSLLRGANNVNAAYTSDGTTFTYSGTNTQYGGVDLDVVYSGPPVGILSLNQANQTLSATGTVPLAVITARLGGSPTIFLCHADSFADDSFYQHALLASPGAQIITSSPAPKFGTGSFLLNAGYITSDRVEDYWFDAGPFTVEAWCYFTTLQNFNNSIAGNWASSALQRGWLWTVDNAAGNRLHFSSDGTNSSAPGYGPPIPQINFNTWQHFAFDRDSTGTVRIYIDGVMVYGSGGWGVALYHSGVQFTLASFSFPGYLDEIRVSRVARYASNSGFTVPSAPFTVDYPNYTQPDQTLVATGVSLAPATGTLGQPIQTTLLVHADGLNGSTTFTDDAGHTLMASNVTVRTAQSKFGTGSADFTANTSAYIDTGNATDFQFGAGQFTIEAWVYLTGSLDANTRPIAAQCPNSAASNVSWVFGINNTLINFFYTTNGSHSFGVSASYTPALNTWVHLVIDRDAGSVVRIYANGVVLNSSTINVTFYPSTLNATVGNYGSGGIYSFPGYLDEIRITKGLARFRGPFTPPTSPYTIEFSGQQANQTVRANNFTPTLTPTVVLSASRAVARSVVSSQDVAARTVVLSDVGVSRQLAVGPPATATLGPIPLASPSCVLLVHADGTAGSTTFIDASPSAHTLTPTSVTVNATAKFGSGAASFTGSTSVIDTGNATDFNFGASPFTVEAWAYSTGIGVYFPSIIAQTDWSGSNNSWGFWLDPTRLAFSYSINGSAITDITASYAIPSGVWVHLAADRDASNTLRIYVNGSVVTSTSVSGAFFPSTRNCRIGNDASGANGFTGRLDEIRVTKGRAMYAGAFTPSTQPFSASNTVLLCHADSVDGSGHWVDSSLNAAVMPSGGPVLLNTTTIKFGIGSANFSGGSNRFISTGGVTDFNFGTAPFTIEMWCYFNSLPGGGFVLASQWSSGNTGWELTTSGTALVFNYYDGTTTRSPSAVFALSTGAWLHVAVDCDATNTMRFYVNGAVVGSAAIFRPIFPSTATCVIGNDFGFVSAPDGYLDEVRISKGVARYAGAFTPPTTPYPPDFGGITQANQTLSAITANLAPLPQGTVLLVHADGTNGSQTFTDSSPSAHTLTSGWNTAVSTTSPKFGTGSVYFPIINSYIDTGNAVDFNFGNKPFTIEAWCYFTSMPGGAGTTGGMILGQWGAQGTYGFLFYAENTTLNFLYSTDGTNYGTASAANTITLNTWVHLAVDLDASGNLRLYNNGAVIGTTTSFTATIYPSTSNVQVGNAYGRTNGFVAGNLDEVLVVKGYAKYGGAFTPATAPYTVGIIQADQALSATGIVPVSGAAWFYRSLATGTGDGLSWANARTSLTNMTSIAAGNTIWVADDHAETSASNLTITLPGTIANPNIVVCADHTVASPASGDWRTSALVTTASGLTLAVNGSAYFYGIGFSVGSGTSTVSTLAICNTAGWQSYDACSLQINGVTVLLCHFDGTDGSTTFIDSSPLAHTLTPSGTVQISTTNPKIGTGSANFSGSPYIDTGNATDFQFGAGPFTIEAWAYPTALSGTPSAILSQFVTSGSNNSFMFAIDTTHLFFYYSINGSGTSSPGSAFFSTPLNTWTHVAVDRDASNVLRLYANGTVILSATVSATLYSSTLNASIGNPQYPLTGRLDELRVTKGVARYGGAFTPPTAPFTAGATDLIQIGDTTSATKVVLNNTTLRFSAIGQMLSIRQGIVQWRNTANAIAGTPPTNLMRSFGAAYQVTCDGVDLGAISGQTIVSNATVPVRAYFNNCRFDAYASSFDISTLAAEAFRNNCDYGNTNYMQARTSFNGFQIINTKVVRTGGASDGTTPVSWQVHSGSYSRVHPFETLPIDQWNTTTGSPLTVAVRGVLFDQNSLPDTSQIWMEAQYLSSASATLASFVHDGLSNWAAVPAVLVTADTSAWDSKIATRQNAIAYSIFNLIKVASNPGRVFICTGSGTSNATEPGAYATAADGGSVTDGTAVFRAGMRFKMSVILTPQLVGSIFVTVKVGDSSVNSYIDPLISMS